MKVAVTGASGFIGKYVAAELERRSISSTLILRPSKTPPGKLANFNYVEINLHDYPENLYEIMGSPDILIHLAWDGLPNYTSHHHFETELPGQFQFLKQLIKSGLQNLVVAGTCFEYGMQSGSLSEDLPCQPLNPYGFAKSALRCQLEFLQRVHYFKMTWARLFYMYGDGQAKSSLFSSLKQAAENGDKIFNMSGGEQLRDYLAVTNVAKYIVSLALKEQNNGIINICSGRPISVRKLVEQWILENNWSIDLNLGHYLYPDYEPLAFWGNCKKLNQCLGDG
jgi:nucleoside-diphosphate-sugar epimerase